MTGGGVEEPTGSDNEAWPQQQEKAIQHETLHALRLVYRESFRAWSRRVTNYRAVTPEISAEASLQLAKEAETNYRVARNRLAEEMLHEIEAHGDQNVK